MSTMTDVLEDLLFRIGWAVERDPAAPPYVRLSRGGRVTISIPPQVDGDAYEALLLHLLGHVVAGDLAPRAWERYDLPDAQALQTVADAAVNASLVKRYDLCQMAEAVSGPGAKPIMPSALGLPDQATIPYSRYLLAEAWRRQQRRAQPWVQGESGESQGGRGKGHGQGQGGSGEHQGQSQYGDQAGDQDAASQKQGDASEQGQAGAEQDLDGQGQTDQGHGGGGRRRQAEQADEVMDGETDELRRDQDATAEDAARAAKAAAKIMARAYSAATAAQGPPPAPARAPRWHAVIRQVVGQLAYLAGGYGAARVRTRTWTREGRCPDLPGRAPMPRMQVAVLLDLSGSTEAWHGAIRALAQALQDDKTLDAVLVAFADSASVVRDLAGIKYGGGTAIAPALELAARYRPDVIIAVTDGQTNEQDLTSPAPLVLLLLPGQPATALLRAAATTISLGDQP